MSNKRAVDIAKWAVNMDVATDVGERIALCKELNNSMYREELYDLALSLGLPVNKKTTKKELCSLITQFSLTENNEDDNSFFYTED